MKNEIVKNDKTCVKCGTDLVITETVPEDRSPHFAKGTCPSCAWWKWITAPKNEGKRNDANLKHRKQWKQKGDFVCAFCTVKEADNILFHCDHVLPLNHGGEDVFENTMMLCTCCHEIKNAEVKRVGKLQGGKR